MLDFSFNEDSHTEDSSRITATRMIAFGIFSLAAKKKSTKSDIKLVSTLKTKTGDIVVEYKSHIDNTKSTTGTMLKSADDSLVRSNSKFRISVLNHTGNDSSDQPIVI